MFEENAMATDKFLCDKHAKKKNVSKTTKQLVSQAGWQESDKLYGKGWKTGATNTCDTSPTTTVLCKPMTGCDKGPDDHAESSGHPE